MDSNQNAHYNGKYAKNSNIYIYLIIEVDVSEDI